MSNYVIYRAKAMTNKTDGQYVRQLLDGRLATGDLIALDPEAHIAGLSRADLFAELASIFRGKLVQALLVIPSEPEDLLVAQAASAIAGAPLGVWLIEDWDFTVPHQIPYLAETFSLATAVFASTSQARSVLQHQMQRRVDVMPTHLTPDLPPVDIFEVLFDTVRSHGLLSDERMERALMARDGPPSYYFDQPVSPQIHKIFRPMFRMCERLRHAGWYPDFVIDVGASNGFWSYLIGQAFPNAKFVLCDPIMSRYPQRHEGPQMVRLDVAVADKPGRSHLTVSSDLFGSSLIAVSDKTDVVEVEVVTLDQIVREQRLSGRGLVKVDVQLAEHLVIEGALRALAENVDIIILELTLVSVAPCRTLLEIAHRLDELGFRMFDVVGEWRDTETGEAIQFDVAFARRDLPNIHH